MLLTHYVYTANVVIVRLYIIIYPRLASLWKDDLLEHTKWLVAKVTSQVTHKRIPVFVHPISPLFEGVKGLRYLHVASKAVSALVELTMTLVDIDF